ncbi:unnamed protein product, partial [Nesidiocoris tenuis]
DVHASVSRPSSAWQGCPRMFCATHPPPIYHSPGPSPHPLKLPSRLLARYIPIILRHLGLRAISFLLLLSFLCLRTHAHAITYFVE